MNTFKPSFFIRLFLMGVCAVALAEEACSRDARPLVTQELREETQEELKASFKKANNPQAQLGGGSAAVGVELLQAFSEVLVYNKGDEALKTRAEEVLEKYGFQANNESLNEAYLEQVIRDVSSVKSPIMSGLKDLIKDISRGSMGVSTLTHGLTTMRLSQLYLDEILSRSTEERSLNGFSIHAAQALKPGANEVLQGKFFSALVNAANPIKLSVSKRLKENRNAIVKFIVEHADPSIKRSLLVRITGDWKIKENQDLEKELQKEVGKALAERR